MSIYTPAVFAFLRDLAEHNERDWFNANRERFDTEVMGPSLAFIEAFAERLHGISPHFLAIAKKQGGSMFRIYRDTRFSKDKSPYKTHVGLQFRHANASRDVHAPGFYLHLEPGKSGVGVGMWNPPSDALRTHVAEQADAWAAVRGSVDEAGLSFMGEQLKRAPKGFPTDHRHVEDLKRKSWAVHRPIDDEALVSAKALDAVEDAFRAGAPLVEFLCESQSIPF